MHTIEQIINDVCANHKSGKWLSCTYQTEYGSIGVKAYGKWVQVVECCGFRDGIPEQKTIKSLRFELSSLLNSMVGVL